MGFLSGTKDKVKFVEAQTSLDARKRQEAIAQTSAEGIPLQQIAEFSELEQQAIDLAGEFMRDASGEVSIDRALDVAIQLSEQKIDLNTPEIQGIIQEVRKSGDLALNRIQRQLQKQGTLSTSAGRDIAGRSIKETELATAGALAPLLADFRAKRLQATSLIPNLVGARAGITQGRIATGAAAGAAVTNLQQRLKDAVFNRKREQFAFETTGRAAINQTLFQSPTAIVTKGGPSELSKAASVAGDIGSILTLGTAPTGGGQGQTGKPTFDLTKLFGGGGTP